MAYVSSSRNHGTQHTPILARLREIGGEIRAAWIRNTVFRQTLAELQSLTDRELTDLGLGRGVLVRVAWEAAEAAAKSRTAG
ncbi:MAG: DUF1127 domain-containing protein [Pseudomonadota bacterium]